MPYIGNPIYQSAFVTDQFSGTGSQTAYTMSVAPAGTTNVLVVVSGVVQDPSTYGVVGNSVVRGFQALVDIVGKVGDCAGVGPECGVCNRAVFRVVGDEDAVLPQRRAV